MEIKFDLNKEDRKALVREISEFTGQSAVYKGVPSLAYGVGGCTVSMEGTLSFEGEAEDGVTELLRALADHGFEPSETVGGLEDGEVSKNETAEPKPESGEVISNMADVGDKLVIGIPIAGFSTTAIDNLEKLIAGKAALIKEGSWRGFRRRRGKSARRTDGNLAGFSVARARRSV
ncbi:hypothetical protein AGMMS49975_00780 [Clostridia bacterium]|nr:hypothetical protein AGMMS49975_00780 [Clostridia bacterium]